MAKATARAVVERIEEALNETPTADARAVLDAVATVVPDLAADLSRRFAISGHLKPKSGF